MLTVVKFDFIRSKNRVLIIGSGPSGILTCGAIGDTADVKVYERASQIGGQWAGLRKDLVENYGHRHSR